VCKTKPISSCPGPAVQKASAEVGLATPNLRRAELCETNPISLGPQEGQSLGAESAKRTQFPTRPGGTGPQERGTRGKRAKRTQFAGGRDTPPFHYSTIPTRCRSCKTNPMWLIGRSARGRNVQNEPNFRRAGYPTTPVCYYSIIPIQCRWCETNPIWAATMESQVLYGKELRNDSPQNRHGKTKPIRGLQADAGERASATVCPAAPDVGLQQLLLSPCPASKLTFFMGPFIS